MIPDAAVEAAAQAYLMSEGTDTVFNCMAAALEAANPYLLAGLVSILDAQVTALENTRVEEYEYPALCAQRDALVGVMRMLQD